jgi:hypothetical protein
MLIPISEVLASFEIDLQREVDFFGVSVCLQVTSVRKRNASNLQEDQKIL